MRSLHLIFSSFHSARGKLLTLLFACCIGIILWEQASTLQSTEEIAQIPKQPSSTNNEKVDVLAQPNALVDGVLIEEQLRGLSPSAPPSSTSEVQSVQKMEKQDLVNMTPEQRRAYFKSKKRALSPERKALRERAEKLVEYAKEQNWQEFLEIIKHFPFKKEMETDHALFTAIIWKAPNSVFNALLNSGAHFTHIHTNLVTGKNDLNYLKRLVALGLDIHAQSHNGENAINALAELPYSTETLEYLLQQNVAIVVPQNSKSPVTVALTKAVKTDQAVLFAAKLLQYGAPPSAEDYELVENLKRQNPKAYQLVKAHIPELIRG